MTLSIVMVTNNSAGVVKGAINSVVGLWDELLVGDEGSRDGTVEIVKKYGGTVILQRQDAPLGVRKQALVEKAGGEWTLVLDADERVSPGLAHEIRRIANHHKIMHVHKNVMVKNGRSIVAYRIPYQNYVFGKPVYYGGEKYAKVRLFKKGFARISPEPLHEEVMVQQGKVGELEGVIHHHSYRTPWQLFSKFTRYARVAAGMAARRGERVTIRKLFLYGPHMFWSRFIKEKGYKDGWRGLVLAAAFGYMEGLTYWFSLFRH